MAEETTESSSKKKVKFQAPQALPKILLAILVLLVIAGATVYAVQQKPEMFGLSKGSNKADAEIQSLLREVGKLVALPTDETPTVATVSEVDKLRDQPFFKNAANGDKIIIYTKNRKAILYRPSEEKIIDFGAVNIDKSNQKTVSGVKDVTFVMLNGTGESGLSKTYSNFVVSSVVGSKVVESANASADDYKETIIVDLKGDKAQTAETLAKAFSIKKADLPDGEKKFDNADFLIIIGADTAEKVKTAGSVTPSPDASPKQ